MAANQPILSKVSTDILKGHSNIKIDGRDVFVKHFSSIDNINLEEIKEAKRIQARSSGLNSEKEQAAILLKDGLWTDSDDDQLFQLNYYIDNLKNTRNLLAIPSQIRAQDKLIEEESAKVQEILDRKERLFGLTVEKWADQQASNYYIYYSLFKDRVFNSLFFEWEEFENLDTQELNQVILSYNAALEPFSENNMKTIALSGQIQNFLSFSDNPYYLFGKPIISMTFFQANLISYAKFYKFILENLTNLPEDVKSDPVKLENSFTASRNLNGSINKNLNQDKVGVGSEMISVVGATDEDLKEMGLVTSDSQKGQLHEQLKQKGELDFMDILKLPEFQN
jgi:hypothetical protein